MLYANNFPQKGNTQYKRKFNVCRLAQNRKWDLVFKKLIDNPSMKNTFNDDVSYQGWTLTDHAAHQMRWNTIAVLRQQYQLFQQLHSSVVIFHLSSSHWTWLWKLIKEDLLKLDDKYTFNSEVLTLYELARKYASTNIFTSIHKHYQKIKTKQNIPVIEQSLSHSENESLPDALNKLCSLIENKEDNANQNWLPLYKLEMIEERGIHLLNPKNDEVLNKNDLVKDRTVFGPIERNRLKG